MLIAHHSSAAEYSELLMCEVLVSGLLLVFRRTAVPSIR
jgi:hypothetical protein